MKKPTPPRKIRLGRHRADHNQESKIEIKRLPDYRVIYVRHIGNYFETTREWKRLLDFGRQKAILDENTLMIGISYDDPQITEEEKLRYDACLTLDTPLETDENISLKTIPGGLFGVYHFYAGLEELIDAYDYIYRRWLPGSGYLPDEKHCFEIYRNNVLGHQKEKAAIDVCFPIRKID